MLFTRLAVAALSFGSIAQVFAVPIAASPETTTAGSVPLTEQTFLYTVAQATREIAGVNAQLGESMDAFVVKLPGTNTSP